MKLGTASIRRSRLQIALRTVVVAAMPLLLTAHDLEAAAPAAPTGNDTAAPSGRGEPRSPEAAVSPIASTHTASPDSALAPTGTSMGTLHALDLARGEAEIVIGVGYALRVERYRLVSGAMRLGAGAAPLRPGAIVRVQYRDVGTQRVALTIERPALPVLQPDR